MVRKCLRKRGEVGSFSSPAVSTPTRRIRWPCCARATAGHAAVLPSPAMNSRRRIRDLPRDRGGAYRGAGCKGTGSQQTRTRPTDVRAGGRDFCGKEAALRPAISGLCRRDGRQQEEGTWRRAVACMLVAVPGVGDLSDWPKILSEAARVGPPGNENAS
jgi:hypothetical protein